SGFPHPSAHLPVIGWVFFIFLSFVFCCCCCYWKGFSFRAPCGTPLSKSRIFRSSLMHLRYTVHKAGTWILGEPKKKGPE
uniref:Neuronatin n=2 Tax=Sus scrofa TaxID=9823 RepID=A0A8D0NZ49_PIG